MGSADRGLAGRTTSGGESLLPATPEYAAIGLWGWKEATDEHLGAVQACANGTHRR